MTALDEAFVTTPLAHRGYHDRAAGRPENGPSAFHAAIRAGYGIELDVQLSSDGQAMVFHDYALDRMTAEHGAVRLRSARALQSIPLAGGPDCIPTLAEVLTLISGRVPLLIEVKDQDGALGPGVGPLEAAVAEALTAYRGPVAVMSFNPHSVAALADMAPGICRGLTTCGFDAEDWPLIPEATRKELRAIPDYTRLGARFISHDAQDLTRPRVAALKSQNAHILCWTIRSPAEEAKARLIAENITFEGYPAPLT